MPSVTTVVVVLVIVFLWKDRFDYLNEAIDYCTPCLDVFAEAQLPESEREIRAAIRPS